MHMSTQGSVAASQVSLDHPGHGIRAKWPCHQDPLTACSWLLPLPLTGCHTTTAALRHSHYCSENQKIHAAYHT